MNKEKVLAQLPQFLLQLFLFVLCIVMLAPFAWVISTSLRLPADSFKLPPSFIPTSFHYENYIAVFTAFPFGRCIFNSLKIAGIVVAANLVISTMAGYAFARIPFQGKHIVFLIVLAGMMIPAQAKLVPTYIVMSKLGLVGKHASLILPAVISPLNIFFVRQYMMRYREVMRKRLILTERAGCGFGGRFLCRCLSQSLLWFPCFRFWHPGMIF